MPLVTDIRADRIEAIGREFAASEKDLRAAHARAIRRTATALATRARKAWRETLDLRSAGEIRRRMRVFNFAAKGDRLAAARLWFGLNDMSAKSFKGRPRQGPGGVTVGRHTLPGAFLAPDSNGRIRIFERKGRARLPIRAARIPIEEETRQVIDAEVWDQVDEIYFRNLRAEVRARTIFKVGA